MNSKMLKKFGIFLIVVLFASLLQTADAFKMPKLNLDNSLGKVLKGVGIVFLVKQFGGELNKFINTLLLNKGAPIHDTTKVVPILTFGQGVEAGACQVSGSAEAVARVQAVLSVAAVLDKGHKFNVQALVPTTSLNPTKLDRVDGVGISAIIDYKL